MHKAKTLWFLLALILLSAGCGSGSGGSSDDPVKKVEVQKVEPIISIKNAEGIANRVWDVNQFVDHMTATRVLGLIHANNAREFDNICASGDLSVIGNRDTETMIGQISVDFNDCVITTAYPPPASAWGIYLSRRLILRKIQLNGRVYLRTTLFSKGLIVARATFENLQWNVLGAVTKGNGNSHYRISNGNLSLRYEFKELKVQALANFSFLDLSKDKAGSAYSTDVEDYTVGYRFTVKAGKYVASNPKVAAGTFHYGSKDTANPITLKIERPLRRAGDSNFTFGFRANDDSTVRITASIDRQTGITKVGIGVSSGHSAIMPTRVLGENHMLLRDGSIKPINEPPSPGYSVNELKASKKINAAGKVQYNMAKGVLTFFGGAGGFDPEYDFLLTSMKMADYPAGAQCEIPEVDDDNCTWEGGNFRAYVAGDYRILVIADDGVERRYKAIAGESKHKIKNGNKGEYYVDGSSTGKYIYTRNGKKYYKAAAIIRLRILYNAPSFDIEPLASNELTQGEQINFGVDVNDNAEGTISYRIVDGPPGVTIDDAGNVNWTAVAPFFGSEGITQTIMIGVANEDRLSIKTVDVNVSDVDASPPSVIPHLKLPAHPGGGTIVDTDYDGIGELLVASGSDFIYNIGLHSSHFKLEWNNPYQFAGEGSVKAVKPIMNKKGELKNYAVLTTLDLLIVNLEGKTLLRHGFPGNDGRVVNRFEVVDLDGDNVQEIIIAEKHGNTNRFKIKVFDQALNELWVAPISATSEFAIGNIDDDDALEIIQASGYIFDGLSFEEQWDHGKSFGTGLIVMDGDGDGTKEFVCINDGNLKRYDVVDGQVVEAASAIAVSGIKGVIVTFVAANIDEDPADELIVGTKYGRVKAFNLSADKKQMVMQWQTDPAEYGKIFEIMLGDVTGDNFDELVFVAKKVASDGAQLLTFLTIDLDGLPKPLNGVDDLETPIPSMDFNWSSENEKILSGRFQKVPNDSSAYSYFKTNVMHKGKLSLRVSRTSYEAGEKNGLFTYQPKVEHGGKLFAGTTSSLHSVAVDDNGDGEQDVMLSTKLDPFDLAPILGIPIELPIHGFKSFNFITGEIVDTFGDGGILESVGALMHFPSILGYGDFDSDGDNDYMGLQIQYLDLFDGILSPQLKLVIFGEGKPKKDIVLIKDRSMLGIKPKKVMTADLNKDGVNEFIYVGNGSITVYAVSKKGALSEVVNIPFLGDIVDLIAADINADGKPELVLIRTKYPQFKDFNNVLVYDLDLSFVGGALTYTGPMEELTDLVNPTAEFSVYGYVDAVAVQTILASYDDGSEVKCRELMLNTNDCRVQSNLIVGFRRHGVNKRTQVVAIGAQTGRAVWRSPVLPGNAIRQVSIIDAPDGSQHLHVITNSAAIVTK